VIEVHVCEQLAQGHYITAERPEVEVAISQVKKPRRVVEIGYF